MKNSNQDGYTFIEILIAAGIIMASLLAISALSYFIGQQKKLINTTHMALSLESSLTAALRDPLNYPGQIQQKLKSGTLNPSDWDLRAHWRVGQDGQSTEESFFRFSTPLYIKNDKTLVASESEADLMMIAQLKMIPPDSQNPSPRYKVAYRLVFLDFDVQPIGSPVANQNLTGFLDADFTTSINEALYLGRLRANSNGQIGQVECNPTLYAGINGFNRNSGAPHCIRKFDPTPVPKSFINNTAFLSGNPSVGIEPSLSINWKGFRSCPSYPDYVLSRVDTRALDPRFSGTPLRHVFAYKSRVGFYTGAATTGYNSLTGYCPKQKYRVRRSSNLCQVSFEVAMMGKRLDCTQTSTTPPQETCSEIPEAPNCSPGSITENAQQNTVTCQYSTVTCPNGGSWKAKLTINNTGNDCEIIVPEFKTEGC